MSSVSRAIITATQQPNDFILETITLDLGDLHKTSEHNEKLTLSFSTKCILTNKTIRELIANHLAKTTTHAYPLAILQCAGKRFIFLDANAYLDHCSTTHCLIVPGEKTVAEKIHIFLFRNFVQNKKFESAAVISPYAGTFVRALLPEVSDYVLDTRLSLLGRHALNAKECYDKAMVKQQERLIPEANAHFFEAKQELLNAERIVDFTCKEFPINTVGHVLTTCVSYIHGRNQVRCHDLSRDPLIDVSEDLLIGALRGVIKHLLSVEEHTNAKFLAELILKKFPRNKSSYNCYNDFVFQKTNNLEDVEQAKRLTVRAMILVPQESPVAALYRTALRFFSDANVGGFRAAMQNITFPLVIEKTK